MPPLKIPPSLYLTSLKACLPALRELEKHYGEALIEKSPLDNVPARIISDLMEVFCLDYYCSPKSDPKSTLFERPINLKILFTPRVEYVMIFYVLADAKIIPTRCLSSTDVAVLNVAFPNIIFFSRLLCNRALRFHSSCSGRGNDIFFHNMELRNSYEPRSDMLDINWMWRMPEYGSNLGINVPKEALRTLRTRPVELYFSDVYITTDTLQQFLLILPKIRILRHEKLLEALYQIHLTNGDNDDEVEGIGIGASHYQLRNLDMEFTWDQFLLNEALVPRAIAQVLRMCPDVTIIFLALYTNVPDSVFELIGRLDTITELTVISTTQDIDFNDFLINFLLSHGQNIERLQLRDFVALDLESVLASCPSVEYLSLLGNTFEVPMNIKKQCEVLSHLTIVHINPADTVPSHLWNCILKSKRLQRINLKKAIIEHRLLDNITTLEIWEDLRVLWLNGCKGWKLEFILSLLDQKNLLTSLHVIHCYGLTEDDLQNVAQYITKQRLDIKYALIALEA